MSYSALPTRTSADPNSSADVNTLQANISTCHCNHVIKTADYVITDTDDYNLILVNSTAGNVTITLPTLADNQNRRIKIVSSHAGGKITIDGEGAETLNGVTAFYLQGQYDHIEVAGCTNEWAVLSYAARYEVGWINRSDWANVHPGTSAFDYDGLVGTFRIGEIITEATSGNTGIIQSDTGALLYVKAVTGTGIWTDGRQITGASSGATADVNETTNNKNQDTDILHEFGVSADHIIYTLWVNGTATIVDAKQLGQAGHDGATTHNHTPYGVDDNNLRLQMASVVGVVYMDAAGATVEWGGATDAYYNIFLEVRI